MVEGLVVDMRYFGDNNFVGERIDGYERPRCLLSTPAAMRSPRPARSGLPAGSVSRCSIAIGRCARSPISSAGRKGSTTSKRKAEFYPDIDKRDLFRLGYLAARSGHSRGSTVDLTLVRRAEQDELDMGTPYDFSGPQSWIADKSVSSRGAEEPRAVRAGDGPWRLSALP